jgi:hypothetical protein
LAALTVLLLALMVLVTLSIAWRVRDRIELQITADAAAYTEAVEVARTFNQAALMNRAQLAMEVAGLGMSSLIAWSSHHYANVVGLKQALENLEALYTAECDPVFNPCPCEQEGPVWTSIGAAWQELQRLDGAWDNDERAAARQFAKTWGGAAQMFDQEQKMLLQVLINTRLKNQQIANLIATKVYDPPTKDHPIELAAPGPGDDKSITEVKQAIYSGDPKIAAHQPAQLSMGTRGYHFTTMGQGGYDPVKQKLDQIAQAGNGAATTDPAFQEGRAGTGIGTDRHGAQSVRTVNPTGQVWAEDHGGTVSVTWPCGCTETGSAGVQDTWLASAGSGNSGIQHRFTPGDSDPPSSRHALPVDPQIVVPPLLTFNFPEIENPDNDFGQPKLYAVIDRDYQKVAKKPWDMRFTFHFTKQGAEFDDNGTTSSFKSLSGADLQHQVGVGSAIVYYHRPYSAAEPDAWVEPPNFFNPFWRATLYAADDDVGKELQKAGYAEQGDAIDQMIRKGALKAVTR